MDNETMTPSTGLSVSPVLPHFIVPRMAGRMVFVETVAAVQLKHITKRFGKVLANHDVSLSINRGEILSLLGENGSAKPL